MQLIAAPGYFWEHGFATHSQPAMGIGCSLVGSVSTGQVRLRSSDPKAKAAVTFNYFAEPEDMDAMVTAIERAREVLAAGPSVSSSGKELHPGDEVRGRRCSSRTSGATSSTPTTRPAPPGSATRRTGSWTPT